MTEAEARARIQTLRRDIEEHNRRYYEEATPTIGDREYDQLYRELAELEKKYPQFAREDSPTRVCRRRLEPPTHMSRPRV